MRGRGWGRGTPLSKVEMVDYECGTEKSSRIGKKIVWENKVRVFRRSKNVRKYKEKVEVGKEG